ncbi:hypothetical protein U9M48_003453 [Paspalum notatum var. saurae]|uniref:Uncharacterized protein n=1 Tax=Paspalum notatum var. saurae TaxID=547442 RepID=A0AAQ3PMY8_PASNO
MIQLMWRLSCRLRHMTLLRVLEASCSGPTGHSALELPEILRVYEGNGRLKEELAAVRASALREEVARLRLELYTAQASAAEKVNLKNQVDILTKQKDAPSSRLKGELTNLKRSYEAEALEEKAKYEREITTISEARQKALEELSLQRTLRNDADKLSDRLAKRCDELETSKNQLETGMDVEAFFKGAVKDGVTDSTAVIKTHYLNVDLAVVAASPKPRTTLDVFDSYVAAVRPLCDYAAGQLIFTPLKD